ncbi:MAG: 4Fe-4S double cluster binding domain-containing protein [bacterium]|nr:4Fe-4S double cluster binding domain-containing protein [bacterium]
MNKKITRLLKSYFVDYIGFADLRSHQDELTEYGGDIVKGYDSGISIGIAIPDSIADHLPRRSDVNVSCEYRIHGYEVLNQRLNLIASFLSSYLNQKGFRSLPIAAADRTDEENAMPTVSHKTIAHIAGLGWIGKNCLLITKEHGPRVRFISILTNAPLKTADNPPAQQCHDCEECIKACPVKAIKGKNFVLGENREARLDFLKCQNYFKQMEKDREYAVCGMCLYSCPHGKKP